MGPAGFEPTTFTRKQRLAAPTGFSMTAPEPLHPKGWSANPLNPSGARRHTYLDYGPIVAGWNQLTN